MLRGRIGQAATTLGRTDAGVSVTAGSFTGSRWPTAESLQLREHVKILRSGYHADSDCVGVQQNSAFLLLGDTILLVYQPHFE